jgi:hypothetical protein
MAEEALQRQSDMRKSRRSRLHLAIENLLAVTLADIVAFLAAVTTKTRATLDGNSTRNLLHFNIASPLNAIRMRASRAVGAGAAEDSWDVCRFDGRGSKEVADAAGKEQ